MLQLNGVVKDYGENENIVHALKGVSLSFRQSELVSILGPSGCGKTTMLNIIGGLDRYTNGDVLINGKSTKTFKGRDWDAYRNNYIGFIFQNYNLIGHQTILANVELALTLSGIKPKERKERAKQALIDVGLEQCINKKPNQLSGGQMQRVAIARALVNNPQIILADEPTGALDSKNSLQIMDLLKGIAKDRLVIMVTHNDQLAYDYSTRIIKMLDGEILDDTMPYEPTQEEIKDSAKDDFIEDEMPSVEGLTEKEAKKVIAKHIKAQEKKKRAEIKHTSMSVFTALLLSLKNLFTKRNRTILTAFAGSIGIIGIALVLSINNGFGIFIDDMQQSMLGQYPMTVQQLHMNMEEMAKPLDTDKSNKERFPNTDKITLPDNNMALDILGRYVNYNKITPEYIDHIEKLQDKDLLTEVQYSYSMKMNLLTKDKKGDYQKIAFESPDPLVELITGNDNRFLEMVGDEFMKETYDLVGANSKYPTKYNEVALVVDSYNQISKTLLDKFYFDVDEKNMTYDSFIGKEFKIIKNDDWYYQDNGLFKEKFADKKDELPAMYENGETLKITGIMRIKRGAPLVLYSPSVLYRKELTQKVVEDNMQSKMVKAQEREYLISTETKVEKSVLTGKPIDKTLLDWSGVPIFGDIFNRIPNSLNPLYLNKEERHEVYMQKIGASVMPKDIFIYPKTFDGKYEIKEHLDAYNQQQPKDKKVYYNDPSSLLTDTMGQIIDIISIVLVCFASVSLVVSSIMIGIITYVSVVERTKEIGVLRSIGARKVDIGNVFNAETAIIGLTAGVMGVALAGILTIPINVIIKHFAKGVITGNIAILSPVSAIILILISVTLTIIAGLIPSNIAAHKDPVQALRTE